MRDPTAFTSTDPKELYNNILIYSVGHLQSESNPHPPPPAEMHIFQCVNIRARDVVEHLKARMTGKRISGSNGGSSNGNGHSLDHFGRVKMDSLTAPYEEVEAEIEPRMIMNQLDEVDETR